MRLPSKRVPALLCAPGGIAVSPTLCPLLSLYPPALTFAAQRGDSWGSLLNSWSLC